MHAAHASLATPPRNSGPPSTTPAKLCQLAGELAWTLSAEPTRARRRASVDRGFQTTGAPPPLDLALLGTVILVLGSMDAAPRGPDPGSR